MVGATLKFDNWSKNIFKVLFKDIDISSWNFNINFWESYGKTTMINDYNELDYIDPTLAKKELIYDNCEVYPEFLELFLNTIKENTENITTYKDFIDSNYFMSLVIIDHRNLEICCKDSAILSKVISNFKESNLENKRVVILDSIQSEAVICPYRSKNDKSIYDK